MQREVLAGAVLELHRPDRDIHDAADGSLREQAIEQISWRIKEGKSRIDIRGLLDSEFNSRGEFLLIELERLLTADNGEHGALADKLVDGLIERYLSTPRGMDLIEEEAAEIEATEEA